MCKPTHPKNKEKLLAIRIRREAAARYGLNVKALENLKIALKLPLLR